MRLILVRHGETTGASSTRYWGKTDMPLSEEGLRQAAQVSARLQGERLDAIYASELKRARVTAETINDSHHLAVTACPELNEVDFGRLEGLTAAEMAACYPEFYRQWLSWDTMLAFPGGESVADFYARVCRFPLRLKESPADATVLVVAHAGTLRMLICHLLGLPLPAWRRLRLDLASRSVVELSPAGGVLTCLNDTAHLG